MIWGVPTDGASRPDAARGPAGTVRGGEPPAESSRAGTRPTSDVDGADRRVFLPAPTLPKGGGAIRGIGETFTVNPARGTGSLAVPLALSPGRRGSSPPLVLGYDTGAGNSPFGLGFAIGVPRVSRRTDRGVPRYVDDGDEADTFILSGAEHLVPALAAAPDGSWTPVTSTVEVDGVPCEVRAYRPRVEAGFARIEMCRPLAGGVPFWRTVSRDNVTSLYGRSGLARISDPQDDGLVFEWLLEEVRDDRGEVVSYEYKPEDLAGVDPAALHERHRFVSPPTAGRYLKRVRYANRLADDPASTTLLVVLDYGEHDDDAPSPAQVRAWPVRVDPFSTYRGGFEVRTWRRCRRVLMFHDFPELGAGPLPRLVRATDLRYADDPTAAKLVGVRQTGYQWTGAGYAALSLPELEFAYTAAGPDDRVRGLETVDGAPLAGGPGAEGAHWVDLDGEGLPGALTRYDGGWWYQRNLGGARLGARLRLPDQPSLGNAGGADGPAPLRLVDLDGDGRISFAELGPHRYGFTDRDPEQGWGPFIPFTRLPTVDFADTGLRQADLDGDGLADLLFADGESLRWHRSLGREGYGPAQTVRHGGDDERGPVLVFADARRSVQLADMTGDGLADLVRIGNGEVCYWPGLGNGRFGPMVAMSWAPTLDHPELFDPARIRLGDVDGSGPVDLVYLAREGVRYWPNQAGNGFGAAVELAPFPACDALSTVELTDLLGTGTACLVWSSPSARDDRDRVRYLDLSRGADPDLAPDDPALAGVKPHLLCGVTSNLGAESRIRYAPSTRHFRAAEEAGEPWLTRLPFPVHVVDRVEAIDHVSGTRLVTRHRYRHGYYDGVEREFRGFGMVESVDAESVPGPPGPPQGDESALPPVRTRTWFHIGAHPDVSQAFAAEYWSGDPLAATLPPCDVTGAATGEEEREARRALAGAALHSEIYADDGSPEAGHPYAVTEHRHRAARLQPSVAGTPAVFHSRLLESVSYHYERVPADPRMTHEVVLDVDEYGTVRESAAIGYRRRQPQVPEQGQTLVTWTRTDVAHTVGGAVHRLATPVRRSVFEVTGLPDPGPGRYAYEAVRDALAAGPADIPYEATPAPGTPQVRLIEESRIGYWNDDLTAELPTGQVGARALPRRTYRLALTPGLVAAAYGDRVGPDLPAGDGGYVLAEGLWWAPSGVQAYDPAAFFLPVAFTDPFGNTSSVTYDAHRLLTVRTAASSTAPYDALVSIVDNDYRVLGPARITDPNGNRSWVALDPLGAVTAAWTAGKDGDAEGDPPDLPGVECTYERTAWQLGGSPVWAQVATRERHGAVDGPWQRARAYSDGLGRVVMTKAQAEPGPAWTLDAVGQAVQVETGPAVRWVGTGRTVLNNKGLPVAQYEPYFSATVDFEDDDQLVKQGVSALLRYDPLGRLARVDHPDGTVSRTEFDPWRQATWDRNDTVLTSDWYAQRGSPDPAGEPEPTDPQRRAAWLAAQHAGTPSLSILDSLGRIVRTVADNGAGGQYLTRVILDAEGNTREVVDARGVTVLRQVVDVTGRVVHTSSPDAGDRWLLPDAAGQPIRRWDGRGAAVRHGYDALRRHTQTWVRLAPQAPETVTTLTVYGEAHPQAVVRNLRGRVYRQYDGAGVVTTGQRDFRGNPLVETRRLAATTPPPDWAALVGVPISGLDQAAAGLVENEVFAMDMAYDALNRPLSQSLPDGTELRPRYNEAGLFESIGARLRGASVETTFVTDVDYDAKGQRERIAYGNGVVTTYAYDPQTFRLTAIESRRGSDVLQRLAYVRDPGGRVVEITDGTQQSLFFAGQVVAPGARYRHDAVYRLIGAAGREHASLGTEPDHRDPPRPPLPHPNDVQALRAYTETYVYDEVGNLLRMVHAAGATGSWTRRYRYADDSNTLVAHSIPGDPDGVYTATLSHDAHGCTTAMPNAAVIGWTVDDMMSTVDLDGGGTASYAYSGTGGRVRKVIRRAGGLVEERIYLGAFELFRRYRNTVLVFERQTVHVGDGTGRVALVETVTVDADEVMLDGTSRLRYQLGDHLSSSTVEVDEQALLISYEEYHPYGTTSVWLAAGQAEVSVKRYRYIGMERDDETGFSCHGVRYYACWLARWISPDPAGLADGVNVWRYAGDDPVNFRDPSGRQRSATSYEERMARQGGIELLYVPTSGVYAEGADAVAAHMPAEKKPTRSAPDPKGQATARGDTWQARAVPTYRVEFGGKTEILTRDAYELMVWLGAVPEGAKVTVRGLTESEIEDLEEKSQQLLEREISKVVSHELDKAKIEAILAPYLEDSGEAPVAGAPAAAAGPTPPAPTAAAPSLAMLSPVVAPTAPGPVAPAQAAPGGASPQHVVRGGAGQSGIGVFHIDPSRLAPRDMVSLLAAARDMDFIAGMEGGLVRRSGSSRRVEDRVARVGRQLLNLEDWEAAGHLPDASAGGGALGPIAGLSRRVNSSWGAQLRRYEPGFTFEGFSVVDRRTGEVIYPSMALETEPPPVRLQLRGAD